MKLLKELTNSIDKTRQDIKTSLAMSGTKTKADVSDYSETGSSVFVIMLD